ncbi:MAG: flagellar protein, partial [Proteobacteria bacterium]|nr:flagellar protein [Pseudomonadota bacterium]
MAEITLSAAVRSSLLSLQNTTVLINRTQGRLATGLAVASAIDDPIKFFE